MVPLAIFGVIVNLAGSISTAMGWCMQKYAHKQAIASNTSAFGKWLWWLGLTFVILTQPLYIVSQSMANQSTLGVVGPFSIVATLMFGRLFLNERISTAEYMCIFLFVPGIILTLHFASKSNDLMNREQFNRVFYSTQSMTYLLTHFVFLSILFIMCHKILKVNAFEESPDAHLEVPEKQGLLDNQTNEADKDPESSDDLSEPDNCVKMIKKSDFKDEDSVKFGGQNLELKKRNVNKGESMTHEKPQEYHHIRRSYGHGDSFFANPKWRCLPLIVYPYLGGFLASLSTAFVRVFTGFNSQKPAHGETSNFHGLEPYGYGAFLVFCAVGSYLIVNKGLKHFDSVYIGPLFKIAGMIHHLLTGGVLLDEFGDYHDKTRFFMFLLGIGICILSIMILLKVKYSS